MKRILSIWLLGMIWVQGESIVGKPTVNQTSKGDTRVARAETSPSRAVQLGDVAQLKIAARKSTFDVGEMITLDIALLNASSHPVFFRKLSDLQIKAQNSAGQPLMVQYYVVADRALVPSSFVRLLPNEITLRSVHLLAGCDKRAFAQLDSAQYDDLAVFKSGLFLNWGDACLQVTKPETYTISIEVKNDFVLLSPRKGRVRTAVGKIKSNSLEIEFDNCSMTSAHSPKKSATTSNR